MKIIYILTRADTIGGVQRHIYEFSTHMLEQGHEVLVVVGSGNTFVNFLERSGIKVITVSDMVVEISFSKDFRTFREFRAIVKEFEPDIVSSHSAKAGVLARIACWLDGYKCIYTAHGWSFTDGVGTKPKRFFYRTIEHILSKISNKIICVSEYDRTIGIKAGMCDQKLITIHNGRKDLQHSKIVRHIEKDVVSVLMVGRFDFQKNHEDLLDVVSKLSNIRLLLLGDGPRQLEIEAIVKSYGIEDRVLFLGLVEDVESVYAEADVFVLSSNWEGFPRSTIEAMRSGLPVVVSDVGGSAEAVDGNGYVVQRGDRAGLLEAIDSLSGSVLLRSSMGKRSRELYDSRFRFEYMLDATVGVYDELQK